jgi:ornithine cyclodeaminase/alanine dehydrogenase
MNSAEYRAWVNEYVKIGRECLWITRKDVEDLGISREDVFREVEKALSIHGRKDCEMPAKIGVHPVSQKNTLMHAMPAYVKDEFVAMIKWGGCFPENRERFGLDQTTALIIYNDHESAWPIAILDAAWITQTRTAAVTAVAVKYLGNTDAATFGMIGCGVQGKEHCRFIDIPLRKLETIYIYDKYEPAMDELNALCQPSLRARIVKAKSIEEVVKSSEIIASATAITAVPEPEVRDEWISRGQTILMCDMHSLYEDATVKRADKYLCDSIDEHELFVHYGYYPHGLPKIYGETGEVVAGIKKGRERADELIVDNNVGMAIEDAVMARPVVDGIIKKRMGRILPL